MSRIRKYIDTNPTFFSMESYAIKSMAPSERMDLLRQTLLQETYSEEGFINWVVTRASRLSATVADSLRAAVNFDYSRPEVINYTALRAALTQIEFNKLMDSMANTPAGFEGNVLRYAKHLEEGMKIANVIKETVKEGDKCISYYLSHPEESSDEKVVYPLTFRQEELAKNIEAHNEFFIKGNTKANRPFSELFDNKNNFLDACKELNDLNEKIYKNVNPIDIKKAVEELSGRTGKLFSAVVEHKPDHKWMLGISEVIWKINKLSEWFGMYCTSLTELTVSMKLNEKKVLSAYEGDE